MLIITAFCFGVLSRVEILSYRSPPGPGIGTLRRQLSGYDVVQTYLFRAVLFAFFMWDLQDFIQIVRINVSHEGPDWIPTNSFGPEVIYLFFPC